MERMRRYGRDALNTRSNWLSLARIAGTVVIGFLIEQKKGEPSYFTSLTHSAVAGTDHWDGEWAREDGTTRAGELLDALSDKAMITTEQFILAKHGKYPRSVLALIATREFGIMAYRAWLDRQGVALPARPFGKAKMVAQMVDIEARLLPLTKKHKGLQKALTAATVALTLGSGIDLIITGEKKRRQNKR